MADDIAPTNAQDDDLPDVGDVSLIDNQTPDAPESDKQPSEDAEKPKDGAPAEDKKPDDKQPDAKATEATDQAEGDKKPDDGQPAEQTKDSRAEREAAAAKAWQQRNRTRDDIAQQLDKTYGPKTEQELIEEGMKPEQASVEALRQEIAYRDQRAAIAELNAGMQTEAVNALNDFSIFNPDSPDYDEEYTKMVQSNYARDSRLQTENGIIMHAELPLYDYYQQAANLYTRAAAAGRQSSQADVQQMMSRAENPGGSSSTGSTNDLDELEERLANVSLT